MRSATLAIGREFRKRHAWPLVAIGVYMLGLALVKLLGLGPMDAIRVVPPDGRAAVLIAPLSTVFWYCVAVFCFGFSGDLAARQSIYPARLFTLPVRTRTLVRGPMLLGMAAVAILVEAATLLVRWPWGIETPLVWPALLAAVFLAWTQALTWMPYGLRGMRVIATVLWLVTLDAVVLLAMHFEVSEPVMLAILAPQIPLAYLTACYAVARARRGDVPDWRPGIVRTAAGRDRAQPQRAAFASPERAQFWFEWRRHGRTLPALVGLVLPFELALLWLARDAPLLLLEILIIALVTPPLLARFTAAGVSKTSPGPRDSYGTSPFVAARPLSSAALIGAKLKMAIWSTLATWVLVLVAIPVALKWSGTWPMLVRRADRLVELAGMPRTIVFALLVLAGLMASTWKQLVQSLYIGLAGRERIAKAALIAALAVMVFIAPVAQWIADHKSAQAALFSSLPSILAVLVSLKMIAATLVAARLAGSGLLSDRAMVRGAACWVAIVFALYGVLAWLLSVPLIPRYFLALIAILLVPLVRLSVAPLAFAWNRHR